MTEKQTLFAVLDIETTYKYRVAFDVAWSIIDRKGKEYGNGSYLITDAFAFDIPFFKEKLGLYFSDTFAHLIQPVTMTELRDRFNSQISDLQAKGHSVIMSAYNAAFDTKHLGETSQKLIGQRFLAVPNVKLLDIWHFWCMSAPQAYNYATDKGNPKTSAEYVYRYETNNPDFVEVHIAFEDVGIEKEILLRTLRRKQKIPIVSSPSDFVGQPWRMLIDRPVYKEGRTIIVPSEHKGGFKPSLWGTEQPTRH